MKANRFDKYNVEVDQNLHSDENSSLNNTNIIGNINMHKVGMDNTVLSQRSNIQQSIKNMNDSAFQHSYSTYNNHHNYHNYYSNTNNITISKDNRAKDTSEVQAT